MKFVHDFKIEFNMDNAAFEGDNQLPEIVRILRHIADNVERGKYEGRVMDVNGNGVGKYGPE